MKMLLSFHDYKNLQRKSIYFFPKNFFPYLDIERRKFKVLEKEHFKKDNGIQKAFRELKCRVGQKYYKEVYPIQSWTLDNSSQSFPAYRFILPEVITLDWLAIVDWHKFQRDHALHQPLTAYIVFKLLGGGDSKKAFQIGDSNLLDLCVDNILMWDKTYYLKEYLTNLGIKEYSDRNLLKNTAYSRTFWKALFFETAFIAATFHDMGYPWQYINLLNDKLEHANYNTGSPPTDVEHIHSLFANRLVLYPFNGYNKLDNSTPCNWKKDLLMLISNALSKTHGLPGALGFLYLNDVLRKFPEKNKKPFHQFCVDWAAMGIMMHDLGKIYWGDAHDKSKNKDKPPENQQMRIKFDTDPLSSIIALADVLEEFNRPTATFSKNEGNSVNCEYDFPCLATELEIDNNKMKIVYKYIDKKARAKKLPYMTKEENEYFNQEHGYIDLSSIGITQVTLHAEVLSDDKKIMSQK